MSQLPPAPPAPPPWPPVEPPAARWATFAWRAITVVAIGLAISAWFRPLPDNKPPATPPAPTFSEQQVVDSKAAVCAAFKKVHQAIIVTNHRDRSNDPTAVLAVATSARQAALAGSGYLSTKLTEQPAAPSDLAAAIRTLANLFQELTVDYLAELSDSELDPLLRASDEATMKIEGLCK